MGYMFISSPSTMYLLEAITIIDRFFPISSYSISYKPYKIAKIGFIATRDELTYIKYIIASTNNMNSIS